MTTIAQPRRSWFRKFVLAAFVLASNDALAAVVWMKARDYRSEEQSPWFQGLANGSLYLEDFLAGPNLSRTFVTPYISSPAGRKGNESGYHSVDGDDGIIDEFGRFGGSYEMGGTSAPDGAIVNFRFDFSRNNDGELPRSVGLVVTNAFMNTFRPTGNTSVATMFDSAGGRIAEWVIDDMPLSIIQSSLEWRPYYTNGAQFVGVVSDVGIASFTITGVNYIDHVQYSFDRIPEPRLAVLGLLASSWYGIARRRRAEGDPAKSTEHGMHS
jgi:hypothetical protein